jgi:hypothetical protein
MSSHDERIDYFLMVTRLMSEAEAQLDADSHDGGSYPYAEDLAALRTAVQTAEEAAARIVVSLISSKRTALPGEREGKERAARH